MGQEPDVTRWYLHFNIRTALLLSSSAHMKQHTALPSDTSTLLPLLHTSSMLPNHVMRISRHTGTLLRTSRHRARDRRGRIPAHRSVTLRAAASASRRPWQRGQRRRCRGEGGGRGGCCDDR